jgi:hypothetical protein
VRTTSFLLLSASLLQLGCASPEAETQVRGDEASIVEGGSTEDGKIFRQVPYREHSCEGDKEGRFEIFGNKNVRYANICIDNVLINFMVTPEFIMGYEIEAFDPRCSLPDTGRTWTAPDGFFDRPVPEQIRITERSITDSLRRLASKCSIEIDSAAFVGPAFSAFYVEYGDGWWFSRLENGIAITPEKGWKYGNVQKN